MKISIDTDLLKSTIRRNNLRYKAIIETLKRSGMGEVITSKRAKMPHERASKRKKREGKKVVHGRLIAWILKKSGHDPFEYDRGALSEAMEIINRGVVHAIDKAADTSKDESAIIKAALLEMTDVLVNDVFERVTQGKLGRNRQRTIRRKKQMVKDGIATTEFGNPPPFGVLTGRFIKGVRRRWRQGKIRG